MVRSLQIIKKNHRNFVVCFLMLWICPAAVLPVFSQDSPGSPHSPGLKAVSRTNLQNDGTPHPADGDAASGGISVFGVDIAETSWLKPINAEKRHFSLAVGRSHVLRLAKRISRVSISDPEVADALVLSPTEILLNAKKEGAINVIFWDEFNDISVMDISVVKDPEFLRSLLQKISPETKFEVYPHDDSFVVEGVVDTAEKKERIEKATTGFGDRSVSVVTLQKARQILVQAYFIQIDLSQDFRFGMTLESGDDRKGSDVFNTFFPAFTNASIDDELTSFGYDPQVQFAPFTRNDKDLYTFARFSNTRFWLFYLDALETKGLAKIIARPNLLATDGEKASFLVGGEAAVIVATGDNISVDYREFGTRLTIKPTIIENDKIRMNVQPEVSLLSRANGVIVNNTQVPGFTTTRVDTVAELRDGETLMIGGLLQQASTETESGVPFLRRIPGLGRFFERTESEWQETELIVLVIPRIVTPEKRPIPGILDKTDLFSQAVLMERSPLEAPQASAIRQYLQSGERFVEEQVREVEALNVPEFKIEIHESALTELDALEAELETVKAE